MVTRKNFLIGTSGEILAPGLGIIIIIACGRSAAAVDQHSRVLSRQAESLPPASITGSSFLMSWPKRSNCSACSRRRHLIQVAAQVLISPLCAGNGKAGPVPTTEKVFVL